MADKIFRNYSYTPTDKDFDKYIALGLNILAIGEKGVGKTTMFVEALKRNRIKYKYFSTPTMDPFLDLRGIPKEFKNSEGNSHLTFVTPEWLDTENIEVIVFDELNRAPKGVTNAVMEIIQFKTINGKPLPKLKAVWAAINPYNEDETYHVEELDEAIRDRFHIIVEFPYNVNRKWFKENFKESGETGCDWWLKLPDKQKKLVSPRRLEYALRCYKNNVDIRQVLPFDSEPKKLLDMLIVGNPRMKMNQMLKENDLKGIKDLINNENLYDDIEDLIIDHKDAVLHLLKEERLAVLLVKNSEINNYVFSKKNTEKFKDIIEALRSSTNVIIKQQADRYFNDTDDLLSNSVENIRKIIQNEKDAKKNAK